ncbi:MAG: mRNA surveillance protein pelota [Halobacteriaceae archaeon]
MRVQDRHPVEGGGECYTLVPESVDDLWHLHHVIEPGDLVAGHTTRRMQRDDQDLRDTGGEREHLFVTLEVEEVELHRFANRLRLAGVIVDCATEDVLGAHHTLNVETHDEIEVTKEWLPDQRQRIEDAVAATENPDVAIATIEEGEAHIHTVAQHGVEERASVTGTTGKGEYARDREELFAELAAILGRMDVDAVVLAGPGFTKRDALDYIEEHDPDVAEKITVVDTSGVGGRGVHEVLTRGAVEEIQAETRIAEEAELVDELMERIATGHEVAYGPEAVERAVDFGAVDELLVLDERLRTERGPEGEWEVDVDDLVREVERTGGEVVVFSGEFEPGQQLRNLGGIAALLRYRID